MNLIKRFIRDESGVTAIEYGLIAAFIGGHYRQPRTAQDGVEHALQ